MLEGSFHGVFLQLCFLDGERGTPFLSVPESVWIPRVWAAFLVSTIQEAKLHCSRSAVGDLVSKPQPPLCSVFQGEKETGGVGEESWRSSLVIGIAEAGQFVPGFLC